LPGTASRGGRPFLLKPEQFRARSGGFGRKVNVDADRDRHPLDLPNTLAMLRSNADRSASSQGAIVHLAATDRLSTDGAICAVYRGDFRNAQQLDRTMIQ
jgi:hypothetical protein